ncbi:hypothetical protein KFK09_029092 [Dendrobium nobile]|uniref:Uncharacterized protein n=1 Tax=Dendrobium nobile TaxID=94219 RepID=A0A8T3A5H1_DENNO|nr:hypothetical protein KFK09_029092 [Dendrobium nobile]
MLSPPSMRIPPAAPAPLHSRTRSQNRSCSPFKGASSKIQRKSFLLTKMQNTAQKKRTQYDMASHKADILG